MIKKLIFKWLSFKNRFYLNPFAYIKNDEDIVAFCKTLILEDSVHETYEAQELLFQALVGYIFYALPIREQNFTTFLKLISMNHVNEYDDQYKSILDVMFMDLEEEDPDNFAVTQYKKYKLALHKDFELKESGSEKSELTR